MTTRPMTMPRAIARLLAALTALAPLPAAAVVIDGFSQSQPILIVAGGATEANFAPDAADTFLGGFRAISVTGLDAGSAAVAGGVPGGTLDLTTPGGAIGGAGRITVSYSGFDGTQPVPLPDVDLTDGGVSTGFLFSFDALTADASLMINVSDGATADMITVPLATGTTSEFLAFSDFALPVDFASVNGFAFSLDLAAGGSLRLADVRTTAIPLPASGVLLLGGVAALALARRRARAG